MSRRDTIIVAVLINAGLLIVLFASALKSGAPSQDMASASPYANAHQTELTYQKESRASSGDEVDQVLSQFSQAASVQSPVAASASQTNAIAAPIAQPVAPAAPVQNNFAEDLQAIASPQPQAPSAAPAPTSVIVSAPQSQITEIKVKKGDVLEKIARQHNTTVSEIMKCNQLATTNLRIGQTLKIPSGSVKKTTAPSVAAPSTSQPVEAVTKLYTIKNGDNPWTIAVKHHMKVEDLLKLNNLDQEKARRLKPGDQIRVR